MGGGSRNAGAASGEDDTGDLSELAELLGTAVRAGSAPTPEGEERAVAAFRAAQEARASADVRHRPGRLRGALPWGDRRPRRTGLPVRAAVGALLASVMLGGVAVASIGTFDSTPDRPAPSPSAPGHAVPPSGRPTLPARPTVPLLRPPEPSPETPPETGAPGKHDHHGKHKPGPKPGQEEKQKPGQQPKKPPKSPKGEARDQGQQATQRPHKGKPPQKAHHGPKAKPPHKAQHSPKVKK